MMALIVRFSQPTTVESGSRPSSVDSGSRPLAADTPSYGVIEDGTVHVIEPHPFRPHRRTGQEVGLDEIRLLAPVLPSKVVCVGKNYADHAAELATEVPEEPLLFLKPSTAVIGPYQAIRYPREFTSEVHYEGELAIVIGRLVSRVAPDDALAAIYGFTCANDVTARDLQRRDSQWTRAKGFDTFSPLGPAISTDIDPYNARVRTTVDGEVRQDGNTADLVFDVQTLVSYISQVMTLLPGDVILTGTPAGVGPLESGQTVRVEIEGIGVLENPVEDRE